MTNETDNHDGQTPLEFATLQQITHELARRHRAVAVIVEGDARGLDGQHALRFFSNGPETMVLGMADTFVACKRAGMVSAFIEARGG